MSNQTNKLQKHSSKLAIPEVQSSGEHVRHVVQLPGFELAFSTDRDQFVGSVARAAGLFAFRAIQQIAGRAWKDTASLVNFGDAIAERTTEVVTDSAQQLQTNATDVIGEVTDTSQKLAIATAEIALAQTDEKVIAPVRKAKRKATARHQKAVDEARTAAQLYCEDAGTARIEEMRKRIAGSPKSKLSQMMIAAANESH